MLNRKIIKLKREGVSFFSRKKFLRLDKNERINNLPAKLFNKLKINSFDITAYPETGLIYKLLSRKLRIDFNQILLIPGSEFGIRINFEYFCNGKNKKIIALTPTFGMVDAYSKLYGVKKIDISYDKNLNINFKKLYANIKKNVSLIIIANPNSPTGTIIEKKDLLKIIRKANNLDIPILIDEAYNGFYNFSYIKYIKRFKNLLILRTFSKSFGLAGLRAGYIVSNKNIAKEIYKYKPMYEINSIACKIIEIFLKNPTFEKEYIASTTEGRKYFQKELTRNKIQYLESYGNFIHINLKNKKNLIEKKLRQQKILTRKGPGVKGFEKFLRITLGPKKEMKKVINVLKKNFN